MVVLSLDNDIKQMFELVLTKLDSMDVKINSLDEKVSSVERMQEEMYLLQRALEENIKVTRAEQENMMHIVIDMQGKVTKLANEVEDHATVIRQIRAIV